MARYSVDGMHLKMDGNTIRNLELVNLREHSSLSGAAQLYHVINRTRTKFGARYERTSSSSSNPLPIYVLDCDLFCSDFCDRGY